ncbi:DcaP family trimeric outer membrane transporter [Albidovulum sp.]
MRTDRKTRRRLALAAALTALGGSAAGAQTLEELQARIEALEARQAEQGRVIVPAGTTFEFGGYVKLDGIYDFDQGQGDTINTGGLVLGAPDGGGFRAHARQTRFWFKTTTETDQGPLKTHFEFDFFGGGGNQILSNSYQPRLRHAYGTWNGFLAGQTWTNFMPISFYPDTLDFQGPSGIPFIRQAQLRYTWNPSSRLAISASLENSEFSGRNAAGLVGETSGSGVNANLDGLPDFTLAAEWTGDRAAARGAVVLRELNSPGDLDSETGWGVNLAGSADLWPGGKIVGSLTYGDGIGRYIIDGVGQDAFVDAAGQLHTITATGATVQISHELTPTLTVALAGGYYNVDETFAPTDTDQLTTVHASLFWKPNKKVRIGGELIYGEREFASGATEDATRLQTSVQFNF